MKAAITVKSLAMLFTGLLSLAACSLGNGHPPTDKRQPPILGNPYILYTDIVSGSTTGGENDNGSYLSIFGVNFGATGLGTAVKVFLGDHEVEDYRSLGPSRGRSDVQRITVQVGAVGNPAPGSVLPVTVTVNGLASNTDKTFTVQPGRIFFVSPAGDDGSGAVDDIDHPWEHVQTTADFLSGVLEHIRPGDTIVLREGTYTGDGCEDYWLKFRYATGTAPTGTAGHGYITVTSYPGETVYIHPTSPTNYGVISGGGSAYQASYITIANLIIEGGSPGNTVFHDGPVNLQVLSDYWRVVNNELLCPNAPYDSKSGGIAGNGRHDVFLGNHIHDTGAGQSNSNEENHGIYLDSGNDYEIAYNVIHDIPGGSAVQTFNSNENTPYIYNVSIHHNLIYNVTAPHGKHGVNIGDTSSTGFEIYNNVIYHINRGGIRFNTLDLRGCRIYNNTIYDAAFCDNSPLYAAVMSDWTLPAGALDVRNNIIRPSAVASYLGGSCGIDGMSGVFSHNLWYGGGDAPPDFDASKIIDDPLFEDAAAGDFHLRQTSPAKNRGTAVVSSLVMDDFSGKPRAQDGGYEIGAYDIFP